MAKTTRDDQPAPKKPTTSSSAARNRKQATTNGKEPAANITTTDSTNTHTRPSSTQSPWHHAPSPLLHAYRTAHRLRTPAAYANPHAHHILEHGIGRYSPTMARPVAQRRTSKATLALAVRKHFNSLPANETDTWVNTLYKARTSEKSLRLKFPVTSVVKPR
ncbi:hypothetical protein BT63DRAFT_428533 [Microthyrium microscopicum]|uniref:Histone deacetylase complex subunit SAP30 Sin3 binding domain-containing protein n=1 Tax=Microthyrium microscopicum TaxID=703497 RepID=A0A6A6U1U7_9PEZI|nr:hypothetical protein BT63DRAFT_428533 [Microthyrium microscopicum]